MPWRRPVATLVKALVDGMEGYIRFRWSSYPAHTVIERGGRQVHHHRISDGRDRRCCALRPFDVRDRLGDIETETLVICFVQDYF